MEPELAACPICGRMVHNDTITLACTGRYSVDDSDEVDCPYFLDVGADTPELQSSRTVRIAEAHNTLARRAEIGKLVEAIAVPGNRRLVLIGDYVKIEQGNLGPPDSFAEGAASLLDALRSLAAEIGGER